jgi:peptidoglycan hydrolase-like protein with peptidoglycan-binding domain
MGSGKKHPVGGWQLQTWNAVPYDANHFGRTRSSSRPNEYGRKLQLKSISNDGLVQSRKARLKGISPTNALSGRLLVLGDVLPVALSSGHDRAPGDRRQRTAQLSCARAGNGQRTGQDADRAPWDRRVVPTLPFALSSFQVTTPWPRRPCSSVWKSVRTGSAWWTKYDAMRNGCQK